MITIWFAVNKNGFVGLYADEPKRNNELGKWESKHPFVNSIIYEQIVNLAEKSNLTWDKDPECIQIKIE